MLFVAPATGQFALERHDSLTAGAVLVPFQSSAAIRRGNASNHLELACVGSTIAARINGIDVASVQDSTYDSGLVMVNAGRSESVAVEARFDNLMIREVEP